MARRASSSIHVAIAGHVFGAATATTWREAEEASRIATGLAVLAACNDLALTKRALDLFPSLQDVVSVSLQNGIAINKKLPGTALLCKLPFSGRIIGEYFEEPDGTSDASAAASHYITFASAPHIPDGAQVDLLQRCINAEQNAADALVATAALTLRVTSLADR